MWTQGAIFALMLLITTSVTSLVAIYLVAASPPPLRPSVPYASRATYVAHVAFRASVLLLYVVILVVEALGLGVTMLSYYTVWTFALQGVYLVWAIVHQLQRQRPSSRQSMYLHSLFDNCLAMSVLVLVVYWSLLYIPKMLWYSYIQHGGNTVLFGIELASTRRELQTHSIAFVLVFPTLYACFAWISVDSWLYRKWPYTFMDLDAPSAPLWYAGIMGGHVVIFGPVWGLSRLKRLAPTAPHSRIKTSNEV
ncbi:hypothetical protein SDRG_16486 [Saprolegnia diclina VS20]|uniref:FAR-17a/AIG1-like protein n=1 Tax=Saprolegnia diclina (strain VS20) TaxID=1156394 RepID=T0PTS4_SAPDV|nr:hypothetical protein SDRG_16486 [Saprolegnia diclina VS20]EQC25631.1 hypothetical protein SDRG_16486 [Saprolegnia diclina VS20]|eukprot:XP_008620922.1 hypothetical protein SDRG_16486 [Saprolegnia diclina VS20]